jgi:hypothetical protein
MAVIVNNPGATERGVQSESNAMGTILGIILMVVITLALLFYLLPAIRNGFNASSSSGPSLNVPSKIDVNVNQPGQ